MKILHTVQYYEPSTGGSQELIKQVSEHLVHRGHNVSIATTRLKERDFKRLNGVEIQEFDFNNPSKAVQDREISRYQTYLLGSAFDVMLNYNLQVKTTDAVYPILDQLKYPAVLATCGLFGLYQYPEYYAELPGVMKKYDRLLFHSNRYRDVQFARQHDLRHYSVIANGASEAEFTGGSSRFREEFNIGADTPLLVTIGNHTGFKGHDLVIKAFRKASIGKALLLIIGKTKNKNLGCDRSCRRSAFWTPILTLGNKRIKNLQISREDTVNALKSADLFVFGSRIEASPIVLFEALASKTPFVSVDCGNAREIAEWTGGGKIIDSEKDAYGFTFASPEKFALEIENIIKDEPLRSQMAETGYRNWKEKFTWEKISIEYENLYMSMIENTIQE